MVLIMETLLNQVTTLNKNMPEYDLKKDHHAVKVLEHFKPSDKKDEEYYAVEILHTQQTIAVPASLINIPQSSNNMTSSTIQLPVTIAIHYISKTEAELIIALPIDEENNLHPLLVNKSYIVGGYTLSKRWGEYDEKLNKKIVKHIITLDSTYCLEHELLPTLKKEVSQYIKSLKYVLTTVKSENTLPPDEVVEFEV